MRPTFRTLSLTRDQTAPAPGLSADLGKAKDLGCGLAVRPVEMPVPAPLAYMCVMEASKAMLINSHLSQPWGDDDVAIRLVSLLSCRLDTFPMVNQTPLCCVPGVQRFLLEIRPLWQSQGCVWEVEIRTAPKLGVQFRTLASSAGTPNTGRESSYHNGMRQDCASGCLLKRSDVS
jgi:hypothetical protein